MFALKLVEEKASCETKSVYSSTTFILYNLANYVFETYEGYSNEEYAI